MPDSILKDLYNDIKTAVDTITGVDTANIDLFRNQIGTFTTGFPKVLVDYPYIYYKDSSAKLQLGNAMVRIMICMDAESGTLSTDIFELKDQVYAKLQGLKYLKCSPLTRGGERVETKYINGTTGAGVYVFEIDFYTMIQDDGVYRYKNLVDVIEENNIDYVEPKINRGEIIDETSGANSLLIPPAQHGIEFSE